MFQIKKNFFFFIFFFAVTIFISDKLGKRATKNTHKGAEIEWTSTISSNSLFLFLNKLPSWLKIILKYLAYYFIGLFIHNVNGYHVYFLKLCCILNLFVIIYYT
jgi:hypothetical protein